MADVLSHLGSAAVIFGRWLDDTLAGAPTPDDFPPSVWAEWDAKAPEAKAADALVADAALVDRLGSLAEADRARFEFSVGPLTVDFAGFVGLRLNEHVLHSWDIEVALDPAATLPPDAAALVVDRLSMTARFTGRPTGAVHQVHVGTSGPERHFTVDLGAEGLTLEPSASAGPDELVLPAEAFVRLVYGRLDPGHTPAVSGPGDLDELRRAFPGPGGG